VAADVKQSMERTKEQKADIIASMDRVPALVKGVLSSTLARLELQCPELAAEWALAPLATIMRDAWAAGRPDVGLELARLSGKRQQQLALIDFAGAADLHMCEVLVAVCGALRGALHAAAAGGHIHVCKLLLANGAATGDGALYAARCARHADVCRLLMLHYLAKFVGTPRWDGGLALILRGVVDWSDDRAVLDAADAIFY
jgi:hypothetical protein